MVDKDFVLERAKYESGIEKDITVGDVIREGRIDFRSGWAGASISYMVNDEGTFIVRKSINYETVDGEPSVKYTKLIDLTECGD